jgi:hypothetical protein
MRTWQREHGSELDVLLSQYVKKSVEHAMDRLDGGNTVLVRERDSGGATVVSERRVPPPLKDCAYALAVSFDKLRILRGQATKIVQTTDRYQSLMDALELKGAAVVEGISSVVADAVSGSGGDVPAEPGAGANVDERDLT